MISRAACDSTVVRSFLRRLTRVQCMTLAFAARSVRFIGSWICDYLNLYTGLLENMVSKKTV